MLTPAPKSTRDRIAILDILRGLAILLIFLLNTPEMGNSIVSSTMSDSHSAAWSSADRFCYFFLQLFLNGTQRGLLQLLFGAGAVILLERTLRPDGPVAAADVYFRRTFFLALFGLFDIFGLLWFGDILLIYAIPAFFLFHFRKLAPATLPILGLLGTSASSLERELPLYQSSVTRAHIAAAVQKQGRHQPLDKAELQALTLQQAQLAHTPTQAAAVADELHAHHGSFLAYSRWNITYFLGPFTHEVLKWSFTLPGSLFSFLVGMALYKYGITQGLRTARFYASLALLCYLPGLLIRLYNMHQAPLPVSNPGVFLADPARVLITLGHLALINLLSKAAAGRRLLAPFQAAGRMAFSLYLFQNFLGMYILFSPSALGLWGRYGWFGLTLLALAVMAAQLLLANLWLRFFAVGPLEWLWRSLTYRQLQPLRHPARQPDPVLV